MSPTFLPGTDVTFEDIRRAKAFAAKARIQPIRINGHEFYEFPVWPTHMHVLAHAKARADWYDYYRAVRTIGRIRMQHEKRFMEFTQCWRDNIRQEAKLNDGRFGWWCMPLQDRLRWYKLGARPNKRLP